MAEKMFSLQNAIGTFVSDGDVVALEGFTHLIPFAAGHEIIRQRVKGLTLVRMTPDIIADQMVAAGCVDTMVFAFTGNSSVGSLYAVRRAIESNGTGGLKLEEYSHYGLLARYQAGAAGIPFMPVRSYAGSDLVGINPQLRKVASPYEEDVETYVVPALNPDVAIIHAQRADRHGNVQSWGILGPQQEVAFASKRTILLVEEIVDDDIIRSDPNRTLIPGFVVDAVVECKYGAHPSFAQGYYDRDNDFYRSWSAISKDPQRLQAWIQEWIHETGGHEGYLTKLGEDFFHRLTPTPHLSSPVNYGSVL
ncbi:CoA transferase subunit A [Pseudarthrobacter enclensis]|uniref:Glutaconate CoA-transferase subunit A n=1 Tax=Pseudarthrobacter enclensis TaxID=993070 RepID=A0ABT9RXL4_9MICC|nr:CoA-transferase [Pseudarthrobacter enclensis]MDP9889978.1 glutaconate CoA-transferase subunit A [Pseudarthrobacter enclensis]